MKTAMRCAACLFVLLWLTGCGVKAPPFVRTEVVEVPVIQYTQIPPALTAPLQAPKAPTFSCVQPGGQPAVCVHDGLMRELEWQAILARANEDRSTAAFLGAGANAASSLHQLSDPAPTEPPQSQLLRRTFGTYAPGAAK